MPKGDIEVFKADIEDGYTKIANLIIEALAIANLSGIQKGICLFLLRRTYGWGIKEDSITLNEFAQACGSSNSYVSRQIKQLIKWQVIIRTNYEPGKVPTYTFNTRVAQWDKGCINVQGLHESTIQGLYKCARVGFNKCTTPEQGQTLDTTGQSEPPKESIKEIEINSSSSSNAREEVDHDISKIAQAYHKHYGNLLNGTQAQSLCQWVEDGFNHEVIIAAMEVAAKEGIYKFAYLEGILRNWFEQNIRTMEDLEKAKGRAESSKRGGFDNERCRGDTQAEIGPPKRSKFARYYENNGTN